MSKWLKASSHLESSKRAQFRERQILSSAGRMIQGAPGRSAGSCVERGRTIQGTPDLQFGTRTSFKTAFEPKSRAKQQKKFLLPLAWADEYDSQHSPICGYCHHAGNHAQAASSGTSSAFSVLDKGWKAVREACTRSSRNSQDVVASPSPRWIGEAENLQNETLVFLMTRRPFGSHKLSRMRLLRNAQQTRRSLHNCSTRIE